MSHRHMHLGLMFWATGTHSAGWRHPDAKSDGAFDIAFIQEMAQLAEKGKFDFLFLGDRLVADPSLAKTNPGQMARLEPFVAASAIAAATTFLGIVVTTNTTYNDPFTVARMLASLDHLSNGRASWNIVTGADPAAALNFSRETHWENDQRYAWANEFTQTVLQLWRYGNKAKLPAGSSIPGSMSISTPPQIKPVVLHAGTSSASRDLGAHYADVIFSGHAQLAEAQEYYQDIKSRAAEYGRSPDEIKILPGLIVVVEETTEQAIAVWDQLNSLILLDEEDLISDRLQVGDVAPHFQYVGMGRGAKRNLRMVSQIIGVNVEGYPHEEWVPTSLAGQVNKAGEDILSYIQRLTRRTLTAEDPAQRITWHDLIVAAIAQTHAIVGNPIEVADYMQYWLDNDAADGFNIFPSFLPHTVDRFVELVVPELQRRGIYRQEYTGKNLRENFGFTRITGDE